MISYIRCDIAWSSIYLLVLEWGEPLGILSTNQWKKDINNWDPKRWAILGDHWSEISLIFFALLVDMDILQWDGKPWCHGFQKTMVFVKPFFRLSNEGHVFFTLPQSDVDVDVMMRLFCVFISIPGLVIYTINHH